MYNFITSELPCLHMRPYGKGRELTTVTNTVEIIEHIKTEQGQTLSDIAEEFDMSKSTAHGYLTTLENCRLISKKGNKYKLGLRLLNLGELAKNRNEFFRLVKPTVEELAEELGEGADFMVEEHGRMMTIYNNVNSIDDPNFQVGKQFYMHNSAGGKAVLAEFEKSEIDNIIDRWKLPDAAKNTITSRERLLQEIDEVRRQGYSVTDEELVDGLRSVGVAIQYPDGRVFGALAIGGPKYRITDKRFTGEIPSILLRRAEEIEAKLSESI